MGWSQCWASRGGLRCGGHGYPGCCARGSPYSSIPSGIGCKDARPGQMHALCQSCPHSSAWGHLRGAPRGKRGWPRGRERPGADHVSGWQRGGSKDKSREKQVLGPVAGELGWRQVRGLDHVVEELHGPHDVLVLWGGRGGIGAQRLSGQLSPNLALPHGSRGAALTHRMGAPGIISSSQALLGCLVLILAIVTRAELGVRRGPPGDREVAQPQSRAGGGFTFWQDSRNSSIVTTPSLFRSIFCSQAQHRGHGRDSSTTTPSPLKPQAGPGRHIPVLAPALLLARPLFIPSKGRSLRASFGAGTTKPRSPGRSSPRAPAVPPPAWPGRCTCPSCRRWTS